MNHTDIGSSLALRMRGIAALSGAVLFFFSLPTEAAVLKVGATREFKTVADAVRSARDDDTIEIDAGKYPGDVAVLTQDRLTIRGVGGLAALDAQGKSAEQKAIWVVRGGSIKIENIHFSNAKVGDRNGVGIRFEKGRLTVVNCVFTDNENGILTGGNESAELIVENSEFGNNGAGDGRSHNIYVGNIARLSVTGSYFHHARSGHLLKSRAAENHILYNRIADEANGRASYELEFANGGIAYVVGNVIQQSPTTENSTMISYGAEGYKYSNNQLYLINNTLIDNRPQGGVYLKIAQGTVKILAVNNLMLGKQKGLESAGPGNYNSNFNAVADDFAQPANGDYRLKVSSPLAGTGAPVGTVNGANLQPRLEYVHPRQLAPVAAQSRQPGAFQTLAK